MVAVSIAAPLHGPSFAQTPLLWPPLFGQNGPGGLPGGAAKASDSPKTNTKTMANKIKNFFMAPLSRDGPC